MKRLLVVCATVILMSTSSPVGADEGNCPVRGPYFGQGPAPTSPTLFSPGFASTQHHDDWTPVFSRDGREVMLRILGKTDGETAGVFFTSRMDDEGCWSTPRPLPFSGPFMDGAITYSPDELRVYFTSKRPAVGEAPADKPRSRIWFSDRDGDGWREPVLLESPINHFHVNGGISMAADGTIYAAMEAPGGLGMHDIYVLQQVDGRYPGLVPIRGAVNSRHHEVAPAVDPMQRFLIYTIRNEDGVGLRVSVSDKSGVWSQGAEIKGLENAQAKFGAISRDGSVLFYVSHIQNEDSNPLAVWQLDQFEGPALEQNADIYWLSAEDLVAQ